MLSQREVSTNRVYGFRVFYWKNGGEEHEIVKRWNDDFAYGADPKDMDLMWIMRKTLSDGGVFLDIGAKIGIWTLSALKKVGNQGYVYSIEADPRNFTLLLNTIRNNGLHNNVSIFNLLMFGGSDKIRLSLHKKRASYTIDENGDYEIQSGDLTTLKYKRGLPTLMRIELNGYEHKVLKNCVDLFKKHNKHKCNILVNFNPKSRDYRVSFIDSLSNLLKLGFKIKYVVTNCVMIPDLFREYGYDPHLIFQCGNYDSGIYNNIETQHVIDFCEMEHRQFVPTTEEVTNNIIRAILISR